MEKLIEYEKKLAEAIQGWGEDALFVFRGHANEEWELDSGADRRLRQIEAGPSLIGYLEKSLLEPARHEGHGRQQNKELNDLELLAALQHNGAATCLIDFTTNFHIALWFACREEDKKDGKVFVVNRGDIHTFEEVTSERATKGIKELLQGGQSAQPDLVGRQQKVYYWKPPPNENRIITQHSCFKKFITGSHPQMRTGLSHNIAAFSFLSTPWKKGLIEKYSSQKVTKRTSKIRSKDTMAWKNRLFSETSQVLPVHRVRASPSSTKLAHNGSKVATAISDEEKLKQQLQTTMRRFASIHNMPTPTLSEDSLRVAWSSTKQQLRTAMRRFASIRKIPTLT